MSDINQPSAPPPQAPPPQAPQTEVPVQTDQHLPQQPLGDQAPPKPPGQEAREQSRVARREALQKAFDRSRQEREDAAKAPATKRDAQKTENQRKPAETEVSDKPQPYRERGRFAPDPNRVQTQQQQPEQTPPGQKQQQYQPLDEQAPYRDPPRRFSDQAKVEWAGAPESVRGAVHQMAKEFGAAYQQYRGDHEVMNGLRPFHDLATRQGTTLERAFNNYYGMEQKLRQDLIGGMDIIVRNLNLRTSNGQPITLYDVAHHIVNMTPEQHRLTAQQNMQVASDMRMGQLHQTVEKLAQGFQHMQYQQNFQMTRAQVDQFAENHPRFDELADLIKQELDLGFPLNVAYARADMLRPAQAAQTRTQTAQTRRTSISGSPDGGNGKLHATNTRGSDPQRANGEQKHPTRREAIAKAMRRVGNGV